MKGNDFMDIPYTCSGYGIILDDYELKPNAIMNLYKNLSQEYKDFLGIDESVKDMQQEDSEADPEDLIEGFIEEYENDKYCWDGVTGFIVDWINFTEFNGRTVFRYEDYCIYVRATLPENEDERNKIPTTERIDEIIKKYVNPYLETNHTPEWLMITLE